MTGKQAGQVLVGVASAGVLVACGLTAKEVSYGTSELTAAGGALTGLGGVGGIIGLLYSLLTAGKSLLSGFLGAGADKTLEGGLAILQSLMTGKQDAIGVTKHAAVAVLFADRAHAHDDIGLQQVMDLAKRCLTEAVAPPVVK